VNDEPIRNLWTKVAYFAVKDCVNEDKRIRSKARAWMFNKDKKHKFARMVLSDKSGFYFDGWTEEIRELIGLFDDKEISGNRFRAIADMITNRHSYSDTRPKSKKRKG